ncbi:hypothetical protein TELCIR_15851 [Teladorsagia circumcincta]|uniref:Uncharacterized protein n=1 Tax=Teladorsagia circumcincta TaxID=45464 RepID=A0A2G9TXF4_TELCI|nr:hypothetical protein TELCIR_15851 [Teladorsagia circumcincta]
MPPSGPMGAAGGAAPAAAQKTAGPHIGDTPYPSQPPPDVNIPPLEGAEPAAAPPTTATTTTPVAAPSATATTTGPTLTTTGTTAPTTTTTTGGADVYGTGYLSSPTPTAPTPTPRFPSDEMTRKETGDVPEKTCDKGQKWKMYMEKTLESGTEGMANEFRMIRGFLPPMATRIAFDANPEKNRFEGE